MFRGDSNLPERTISCRSTRVRSRTLPVFLRTGFCLLFVALLLETTGCFLRSGRGDDEVAGNLQVEPVYVSFEATPWADIYLNGTRLGRTPISNHPVMPGQYQIRFVNKELRVDIRTERELVAGPFGNTVTLSFDMAAASKRGH